MSGSDSDLVRRCLAGDEDASRELVRRYERGVYFLIWQIVRNVEDARDLTQETFVKAFRALDRFERDRRFLCWINRIATNTALDFLRSRRRMESLDADPEDDKAPLTLVDPGPLPSEESDRHQIQEALDRLVERLSPPYRVAIHLRYVQQLSYEEIAEILNVSVGTVKSRLHRSHEQLRVLLVERDRLAGGRRNYF